jgi:hypothetical protein
MQNFMTRDLAGAFIAEAERHWLYGHPYRVERPRRERTVPARSASARRPFAALRRLRAV